MLARCDDLLAIFPVGPGEIGGLVHVLGAPSKAVAHSPHFDAYFFGGPLLAKVGGGVLDELEHDDLQVSAPSTEQDTHGGGGLSLAVAGVDDHQSLVNPGALHRLGAFLRAFLSTHRVLTSGKDRARVGIVLSSLLELGIRAYSSPHAGKGGAYLHEPAGERRMATQVDVGRRKPTRCLRGTRRPCRSGQVSCRPTCPSPGLAPGPTNEIHAHGRAGPLSAADRPLPTPPPGSPGSNAFGTWTKPPVLRRSLGGTHHRGWRGFRQGTSSRRTRRRPARPRPTASRMAVCMGLFSESSLANISGNPPPR